MREGAYFKPFLLLTAVAMAVFAFAPVSWASTLASPLTVWVQPSGETFSNAYVVTGESRTYFGRVEGGTGNYQYKWDFSDGTSTAYAAVGDPRYISTDHTFATAGDQYARLTVMDDSSATNSATILLKVVLAGGSDDTLTRQKNSAIDRGLRYMYQQENPDPTGQGSTWPGSGASGATTGMALVAFENQGHNLQSPDTDIYKKSVQEGVRWILNNSQTVSLSNQACIGDPEAGTLPSYGKNQTGVEFPNGSSEMYVSPIQMLALVNSCDLATAKTYTVSTVDTTMYVNGKTLYDIMVDAKDFVAYAQADSSNYGQGGGGNWFYPTSLVQNGSFGGIINGLSITSFYADWWALGGAPCPGMWSINWGDGNTDNITDPGYYCYYPEAYIYDITHTYATGGTYTINVSYAGIPVATGQITATGGSTCPGNGWRYSANEGDSDNSLSQWSSLALAELKNRWGIQVNPAVITQLDGWLSYSQCDNGAFGYTAPNDWCNFPKTGAGLIMLKYCGYDSSNARVQSALNFLANDPSYGWNSTCYDGNFGSFYGMYAFYKGMKSLGLTDLSSTITGWESQYDQWLVSNQQADGHWPDCSSWVGDQLGTYMGVAILAPAIASLPPVAVAGGPYGPVNANQIVTLDGSKSYDQDPTKQIIKYEWDTDAADGLCWNGQGASCLLGVTVQTKYPDTGSNHTYTVTLRVTDNSNPAQTATATSTVQVVSGHVAPVAVTNGPWTALPNVAIKFDGSGSYSPNACTTANNSKCLGLSIVKWEWSFDGGATWTDATSSGGILMKSFPQPMSFTAILRVTDSSGTPLQGTSSATGNIVAINIVFGQQYQNCFSQIIDRFTQYRGITVRFKNQGNGAATNLVMTLTQAPTNFTQIVKGVSNLGTLAAGAEKWTVCGGNVNSTEIVLKFDSRVNATGVWQWRAEFDYNGQHYVVGSIPALGP